MDKSFGGLATVLVMAVVGAGAGCSSEPPLNPSFPLTLERADAELARMKREPVEPQRPVVVVGGLFDVGIAVDDLTESVRNMLAPDAPIVEVGMLGTDTMEECREKVIAAVETQYPSGDPRWTVEVDAIGFSLGAVVVRDAALDHGVTGAEGSVAGGGKRLRIKRLFTLAGPHRGAESARIPTLDDRVEALRPDSAFMRSLQPPPQPPYEIEPYSRLWDDVVDPTEAAPPGMTPWWVYSKPYSFTHGDSHQDQRLLADIGARLRGETPFTQPPPAPLPPRE